MEQGIYIKDKNRVEKVISQMAMDGADKLHLLCDFDKTLTTPFLPDGQISLPSIIAAFRTGKYLTSDYAPKAHALYEKYRPIEIDPTISFEQKSQAMEEWWQTHFNLMVECGLDRETIRKAIVENKIYFRAGSKELFVLLEEKNIPLVIMSAGPGSAIEIMLQEEKLNSENIFIIANIFIFDNHGKVVEIKKPIIHSMNKSEIAVKDFPEIFSVIESKRNVILMGDHISDVGMIDGFSHDNLIKIGFLQPEFKEIPLEYKENFDIVASAGSDLNFVTEIIRRIVS